MPSCALTISVHKKFATDLFYEIVVYIKKNAWTFSYHKAILDLNVCLKRNLEYNT